MALQCREILYFTLWSDARLCVASPSVRLVSMAMRYLTRVEIKPGISTGFRLNRLCWMNRQIEFEIHYFKEQSFHRFSQLLVVVCGLMVMVISDRGNDGKLNGLWERWRNGHFWVSQGAVEWDQFSERLEYVDVGFDSKCHSRNAYQKFAQKKMWTKQSHRAAVVSGWASNGARWNQEQFETLAICLFHFRFDARFHYLSPSLCLSISFPLVIHAFHHRDATSVLVLFWLLIS